MNKIINYCFPYKRDFIYNKNLIINFILLLFSAIALWLLFVKDKLFSIY